jgi:hypothetical protein
MTASLRGLDVHNLLGMSRDLPDLLQSGWYTELLDLPVVMKLVSKKETLWD